MPRVSVAEKQKSRARILDAAATLFRAQGIATTSVSDVMQAAGLTHGGFYRHFGSKAELVLAAFDHAIMQVLPDRSGGDAEKAAARAAYLDRYLSLEHAQNPGSGCPIAGMGTELAHTADIDTAQVATAIGATAALLDGHGEHATPTGKAALALLIGTITLARLAKDETDAQAQLAAGAEGMRLLSANASARHS